jgi:hypothetical protein
MTMHPLRAGSARAVAIVLGAGVLLAGCDSVRSLFARGAASQETGSEPVSAAALQSGAAPEAAPAAQAAPGGDPVPAQGQRSVEFPATAQSVADDFGPDTEKFATAVVPVLAPASMSSDQASGFGDSFRETPDGYFARMAEGGFDVVVNGTRSFAVAPAAAGAPPARDTSQILFSETDTGASVTFSRFGADYFIDFVCKDAGEPCITEAQATEFVERLVPVGGGGR